VTRGPGLQIDGPPPETLRRDQLQRRQAIIRSALRRPRRSGCATSSTARSGRSSSYGTVSAQFRDVVSTAFDGAAIDPPAAAADRAAPFDPDHEAICNTINAVLDESPRSWVVNRATIADVYRNVDNAIRLIYEYPR